MKCTALLYRRGSLHDMISVSSIIPLVSLLVESHTVRVPSDF